MISTRTPLRVTLGGGGSDLSSYYKHRGGFIFAMALDKYIHVNCHRPAFDRRVVISGSEVAERAELVRHELVRGALLHHDIHDQFELTSIADVAGGTGLGSSSCFLVGLLNALHALKGQPVTAAELAEEACAIEIHSLAKGIGKQDQYMAAFGGLTILEIAKDGTVETSRVDLDPEIEAAFLRHTHIYYTGLRRDAAVILSEQNTAMEATSGNHHDRVLENLDFIKDLGRRILTAWRQGDLGGWGAMLDEHWQRKKQLSSRISWPQIDELYDTVRAKFRVAGGKVIGAGGGGFLMLFCPHDGAALEEYMVSHGMPRLNYRIDREGTRLFDYPKLGSTR
ncbi:MAG TPA: hypothetical protein VNT30_25830 [Stellaceae bacterium]|nr:hypothetical protein [Stellaceae bacterium]